MVSVWHIGGDGHEIPPRFHPQLRHGPVIQQRWHQQFELSVGKGSPHPDRAVGPKTMEPVGQNYSRSGLRAEQIVFTKDNSWRKRHRATERFCGIPVRHQPLGEPLIGSNTSPVNHNGWIVFSSDSKATSHRAVAKRRCLEGQLSMVSRRNRAVRKVGGSRSARLFAVHLHGRISRRWPIAASPGRLGRRAVLICQC